MAHATLHDGALTFWECSRNKLGKGVPGRLQLFLSLSPMRNVGISQINGIVKSWRYPFFRLPNDYPPSLSSSPLTRKRRTIPLTVVRPILLLLRTSVIAVGPIGATARLPPYILLFHRKTVPLGTTQKPVWDACCGWGYHLGTWNRGILGYEHFEFNHLQYLSPPPKFCPVSLQVLWV